MDDRRHRMEPYTPAATANAVLERGRSRSSTAEDLGRPERAVGIMRRCVWWLQGYEQQQRAQGYPPA